MLAGLGPLAIASILGSYFRSWAMPVRPEVSLEDWITNRFGRTLFRTFFRNYTEKVCGIPCGRVSADWAAQRIRNLDLRRAVLRAMGIGHAKGTASLIEGFDYPRLGPGQMYEAMAAQAQAKGATILTGREVVRIEHDAGRVTRVIARTPDGTEEHQAGGEA